MALSSATIVPLICGYRKITLNITMINASPSHANS
jgi:hypothetical protein